MIKKIIFFKFLLVSTMASAQFAENHFIYIDLGVPVASNYSGSVIDADLNYIYKQKYTFEFGFSFLYRESESQPEDYNYDPFIDLWPTEQSPFDQIYSFKLLTGRLIKTKSKLVRFNLKGGLSYSRFIKVTSWEKVTRSGFFGSSYEDYDYELEKLEGFGLVIEPSIEFPLTRVVGLSVSPFAYLSNQASAYGLNLEIMLGYLRDKRKPRKPIIIIL